MAPEAPDSSERLCNTSDVVHQECNAPTDLRCSKLLFDALWHFPKMLVILLTNNFVVYLSQGAIKDVGKVGPHNLSPKTQGIPAHAQDVSHSFLLLNGRLHCGTLPLPTWP